MRTSQQLTACLVVQPCDQCRVNITVERSNDKNAPIYWSRTVHSNPLLWKASPLTFSLQLFCNPTKQCRQGMYHNMFVMVLELAVTSCNLVTVTCYCYICYVTLVWTYPYWQSYVRQWQSILGNKNSYKDLYYLPDLLLRFLALSSKHIHSLL